MGAESTDLLGASKGCGIICCVREVSASGVTSPQPLQCVVAGLLVASGLAAFYEDMRYARKLGPRSCFGTDGHPFLHQTSVPRIKVRSFAATQQSVDAFLWQLRNASTIGANRGSTSPIGGFLGARKCVRVVFVFVIRSLPESIR
jgi:hypothetical protein